MYWVGMWSVTFSETWSACGRYMVSMLSVYGWYRGQHVVSRWSSLRAGSPSDVGNAQGTGGLGLQAPARPQRPTRACLQAAYGLYVVGDVGGMWELVVDPLTSFAVTGLRSSRTIANRLDSMESRLCLLLGCRLSSLSRNWANKQR